jgi:hypothetical protein
MTLTFFNASWNWAPHDLSSGLSSFLPFPILLAFLSRGGALKVGCSTRLLSDWSSGAMGIACTGVSQTAPVSSPISCLAWGGQQRQLDRLASAFGRIPSSPADFCRCDGRSPACCCCSCSRASRSNRAPTPLGPPSFHHVAEPHDGLGSVAAKISKESLVGDAFVEAVDDILLGDVGDGGC